jgi:mannose-6-phosphate isomerase-like protein (cupin superfamily)
MMKSMQILTAVLFFSCSTSSYAATPNRSVNLVPANNIQWSPVDCSPGVYTSALDDDASTGNHHFLLKFDPGFSAPMHHHSSNHFVTVVSGTLVLVIDGKEQRLPAGSYFSFTGMKPHMTRCEQGTACVLSMDVRGKWDVVPEATKK